MKIRLIKFFSIYFTAILPLTGINGSESAECNQWVLNYINNYPDFPIGGIQFKFYSPLLKDPAAFKKAIKACADRYRNTPVDAIAALDAKGYIFGATLAYELNLPLVLVRKEERLPTEATSVKTDIKYGSPGLKIEKNVLVPHEKVLIVDDIIATGNTVIEAGKLIEDAGAVVYEVVCLIELSEFKGRENIPYPLFTLISLDNN